MRELQARISEAEAAIYDAQQEMLDWSDPSSGRTACACIIKRIETRLRGYRAEMEQLRQSVDTLHKLPNPGPSTGGFHV